MNCIICNKKMHTDMFPFNKHIDDFICTQSNHLYFFSSDTCFQINLDNIILVKYSFRECLYLNDQLLDNTENFTPIQALKLLQLKSFL